MMLSDELKKALGILSLFGPTEISRDGRRRAEKCAVSYAEEKGILAYEEGLSFGMLAVSDLWRCFGVCECGAFWVSDVRDTPWNLYPTFLLLHHGKAHAYTLEKYVPTRCAACSVANGTVWLLLSVEQGRELDLLEDDCTIGRISKKDLQKKYRDMMRGAYLSRLVSVLQTHNKQQKEAALRFVHTFGAELESALF